MFKKSILSLLAVSFILTMSGNIEAKLQRQPKVHATKTHAVGKHAGKQQAQPAKKQQTPKKQQQKQTKAKVNKVAAQQFQNNAAQVQAKISQSAATHIQQRHWFNAQQGPNTSHFHQNMTIQKLNQLATTTINNGSQKPSPHGQGRSTYQYRFSRPLGTDTNGNTAYALRVVADQQYNVITAFPVK